MVRYITFLVVSLILILIVSINCHSHSHSHDNDEPAHFKYSQQANDIPDPQQEFTDNDNVEVKTHDSIKLTKVNRVADLDLWVKALGSTALVSITPVFILILIPLDQSKERDSLLKILLSFASGGLLGDAFLHLIPHALNPHTHGADDNHGHSHSHADEHDHTKGLLVGLWVLGGIITFLCVEKFVRIMKVGHSHSQKENKKELKDSKKEKETDSKKENVKDSKEIKNTDDSTKDIAEIPLGEIHVAGYLNLVADFTHNFTDGLAIGVSYLLGQNVGVMTTITILFHEIPHEIGDFAILVQSGCSKKKAMLLQFTTAIGAMAGTLVSLCLGGVGPEAMAWILPFTAGGFIYIATVSVIPDLLKETSFCQSIKEIFAMLVGVGMMVIIGIME